MTKFSSKFLNLPIIFPLPNIPRYQLCSRVCCLAFVFTKKTKEISKPRQNVTENSKRVNEKKCLLFGH